MFDFRYHALSLVAVFANQLTGLIGHGPNEQYRDQGLAPNGLPVAPGSFFWLGGDDVGFFMKQHGIERRRQPNGLREHSGNSFTRRAV